MLTRGTPQFTCNIAGNQFLHMEQTIHIVADLAAPDQLTRFIRQPGVDIHQVAIHANAAGQDVLDLESLRDLQQVQPIEQRRSRGLETDDIEATRAH